MDKIEEKNIWYTANIITYITHSKKSKPQYFVDEIIVLFKVKESNDPFEVIDEYCKTLSNSYSSKEMSHWKWDGKPTEWKCGGVRKINRQLHEFDDQFSFIEISNNTFHLKSKKQLNDLIAGRDVYLCYLDE